jgi:carbon monoxide dehydrogenase subunit G
MALTGSSTAEIDAPIEDVWALVEDVAIAPEWQGGLLEMNVLNRDDQGRAVRVESVSDGKVRNIKAIVRFAYEGPTKLSWTQEKGDAKSVNGSWTLADLGDGRTRATYDLDVDLGRMLGMVVRGPIEGFVRDMLVNARAGELKARAEQG